MTLSPGGILARLDELKKWQQLQQERFSSSQTKKDSSDNLYLISPIPKRDTSNGIIEGVAPFSDSDNERQHQMKAKEDRKQTFKELTNETLKVAKKPFLRKGSGLAKYRMTLEDTKPVTRPPSCILNNKSIKKKTAEPKKLAANVNNEPVQGTLVKSSPPATKVQTSCPKSPPIWRRNTPNSDVKVPASKNTLEVKDVPKLEDPKVNFLFKPKGLWTNVSEMHKPLTPVEEEESIISQINRIVSMNEETNTTKDLNMKMRQFAGEMQSSPHFNINDLEDDNFLAEIERFFKNQQGTIGTNPADDEFITPVNVFKKPATRIQPPQTTGNPPQEINQSERELRAFEALEQKAMQSSFCSTNSSVAYLLSMQSTPKKANMPSVEASPNSTINSEDIKDEAEANYEDDNHWSTTEVESDTESEEPTTVRSRILIVVDAETMTDEPLNETPNDNLLRKLRVLEDEIQVFRNENSRLAKTKIETEKEMRELRKQKKEIEEEKQQMLSYLEDEKRKLAKDKMVFEKYVKDLKNKPSKKEREEITMLRNDLATAKEELKLKESRHGAAQARLRTQIKQLEKDKEILIKEHEALRTQNGRLVAQQKLGRPMTDTKVIHEINKKLTKLTQQEKPISEKKSSDFKRISSSEKSANTSLYANITEDEDEEDTDETDPNEMVSNCSETETQIEPGKSMEAFPVVYARQITRPVTHPLSSETILDVEMFPPSFNFRGNPQRPDVAQENNRNLLNFSGSNSTFKTCDSVERDYENMFSSENNSKKEVPQHDFTTLEENHKRERKERRLIDGTQEITYPNGNVKTISPDGNLIKMHYYNGDVKKTDLSAGIIDYLYAESGIRHVTYSDGTEILNFPDGKVEKRYKDGSYEIITPDGFVRSVDTEGKEDMSYPDGTRVSISGNGEKVVKLPNGQRIVHTKEHKRREYPDGTVNILYPDGLLETRYKNGRIRLKDANGRCLMDSHGNNTP